MADANAVWGGRLKTARLESGLSQKDLGIAAGLDPSVASTRINRYELGIHKADYLTAQRLADVLKIPVAYLYADDDDVAELLLAYAKLSVRQRGLLLRQVKALVKE